MYRDGKVCFISILTVGFLDDYGRGNQLSKVIHDQSGKDLLVYVLHLFCVKVKQSYSILQFPERCFYTPAHIVKLLQFVRRKLAGVEVGDNWFKNTIGNFEPNDTKREMIENRRIVFSVRSRQIIEAGIGGKDSVFVSVQSCVIASVNLRFIMFN